MMFRGVEVSEGWGQSPGLRKKSEQVSGVVHFCEKAFKVHLVGSYFDP